MEQTNKLTNKHEFNNYSSEISSSLRNKITLHDINAFTNNVFNTAHILLHYLLKLLIKSSLLKTCGPDNIPAKLLLRIATIVLATLQKYYLSFFSLWYNIFSECLKKLLVH